MLRWEQNFYSSPQLSLILAPTQPSNQSLCPESKLYYREYYQSTGYSAEIKTVDINLHSPIRFDGVLVNNTVTDLFLVRSVFRYNLIPSRFYHIPHSGLIFSQQRSVCTAFGYVTVCSVVTRGSVTSSQRIHGYICVFGAVKLNYFLNKELSFVTNNRTFFN